MSNKDVFIGSSNENKPVAEAFYRALLGKKIKPMPWWDSFPAGNFTLMRLLEIARAVDGAVFVFGKDDKTWYRNTEVTTPRDNVILEMGIFVSQLGPERCIIVRDDDAKMPSDTGGLSYLNFESTTDLTAQRMSEHFERVFRKEPEFLRFGGFGILFDNRLGPIQVARDLPKDWMLRGCYLGIDGAKAWLSVSTDPAYICNSGVADLRSCILEYLKETKSPFRTFVSLGPGDGFLDWDIILELKKDEPSVQYIPVDISDGLLMSVCVLLQARVSLPVGVLADFEGHWEFIASSVKKHGKTPVLFGLLGGTFGNLDTSEYRFLSGVISSLSHDDVFIMDIAVNRDAPAPDVQDMSSGRKEFYSHGASRFLGISPDIIFNNFNKYITAELRDGPSDVPGTKVVVFSAINDHSCQAFAYMRRYTLSELEKWLRTMMRVEVTIKEFRSSGRFGRALLILKRKP